MVVSVSVLEVPIYGVIPAFIRWNRCCSGEFNLITKACFLTWFLGDYGMLFYCTFTVKLVLIDLFLIFNLVIILLFILIYNGLVHSVLGL